jgi:hypothetical protein
VDHNDLEAVKTRKQFGVLLNPNFPVLWKLRPVFFFFIGTSTLILFPVIHRRENFFAGVLFCEKSALGFFFLWEEE